MHRNFLRVPTGQSWYWICLPGNLKKKPTQPFLDTFFHFLFSKLVFCDHYVWPKHFSEWEISISNCKVFISLLYIVQWSQLLIWKSVDVCMGLWHFPKTVYRDRNYCPLTTSKQNICTSIYQFIVPEMFLWSNSIRMPKGKGITGIW